jgi:peptidoglycan hydrolase CwlO-like protein
MIDPSFWVALAALIVSIVFGIITATRNGSIDVKAEIDEAKKEAALSAKIETALNSIQSDTREIKADQKGVRADITDMNQRLTKVEESLKSAWVRIDEIRGMSKKDEPGE